MRIPSRGMSRATFVRADADELQPSGSLIVARSFGATIGLPIAAMKILFVLLAIVLNSVAVRAQATIKGCVTDQHGGALPGVQVVASNSTDQWKIVTDSSGCYVLIGIPAGTYSVTADLLGMVTPRRDGVAAGPGQTVEDLDFELCLRSDGIDWVLPGGLAEAWEEADLVAEVRIVKTRPVQSPCPTEDVVHTAAVVEMFKGETKSATGQTLTFRQENWSRERAPYAVGQQMILFLVANGQELFRLAGPYYAFLINGDAIASFDSSVNTEGMNPSDFRQKLRALTGGGALHSSLDDTSGESHTEPDKHLQPTAAGIRSGAASEARSLDGFREEVPSGLDFHRGPAVPR